MNAFIGRRTCLTGLAGIGPLAAGVHSDADSSLPDRRNQVVVTPAGPGDGGDFGPGTPGTKTSGLQEAFDAAKRDRRDLYICGGSWTEGVNQPVVYHLHETLRIPWMQDFRVDSGHGVIQYVPRTGHAVEIDSQMSCFFRLGLIVSNSDGAVVRLNPVTKGPDRFRVITATEFHINALVGGGGAWPGGEPFNSQLDQNLRRPGIGLWCDGRTGSIDANEISVTEIVGCRQGLFLDGAVTHNFIRAANIHLCHEHLTAGTVEDGRPRGNDIQAAVNSEGIPDAVGVRMAGQANRLQLIVRQMSDGNDVILEETSADNMIISPRLPHGITIRTASASDRVCSAAMPDTVTPAVPRSREWIRNTMPWPVEVRVIDPGDVQSWSERSADGAVCSISGGLFPGQSFLLNPGDAVKLTYHRPPRWRWKTAG